MKNKMMETKKAYIFVNTCPADNKNSYTIYKKNIMFGIVGMNHNANYFTNKRDALKFASQL